MRLQRMTEKKLMECTLVGHSQVDIVEIVDMGLAGMYEQTWVYRRWHYSIQSSPVLDTRWVDTVLETCLSLEYMQ